MFTTAILSKAKGLFQSFLGSSDMYQIVNGHASFSFVSCVYWAWRLRGDLGQGRPSSIPSAVHSRQPLLPGPPALTAQFKVQQDMTVQPIHQVLWQIEHDFAGPAVCVKSRLR